MNIAVITNSGKIVVRPDTTWERDDEALYVPDFVTELTAAPVLCAKICKPGRSIGLKFADRYVDQFGYGILLYPENFIDGSPEGFASACCLDHSSFIRMPEFSEEELASLQIKGFGTFQGRPEMIKEAVAQISTRVYLRTGDIIAVELQERSPLPFPARLSGLVSEKTVFDFEIK